MLQGFNYNTKITNNPIYTKYIFLSINLNSLFDIKYRRGVKIVKKMHQEIPVHSWLVLSLLCNGTQI